jgi:hypothetical protein
MTAGMAPAALIISCGKSTSGPPFFSFSISSAFLFQSLGWRVIFTQSVEE